MSKFEFRTSQKSDEFCSNIATEMMSLSAITQEEVVARINRDWKGLDLSSPQDVIYHEDETYWAKNIYYGNDSYWWLSDARPKPRPAP